MSITCTHKDAYGKVCGHVNADGNSYCVKCGNPLDGKTRKVVIEQEYKDLLEKVKNSEILFDGVYNKLQKIYKEGYAPKGMHLEKDKSLWEKYSYKTLTISEYNKLLNKANQSWREKLWETIKKWWDDIGEIIFYFSGFVIIVCVFIWSIVGDVVSSCSNNSNTIKTEQRDGMWGMVIGDDVIIPFEYDSIVCDKYDTIYSRIYKNGMVGLVDNRNGKTIVQCAYLQVGYKQKDLGGELIGVQKSNNKWGFVNRDGNVVGKEYDYARWLTGKEFGDIGKKDERGKWYYGYVDSKGNEKISCRYVESGSFNEGLAMVKTSEISPWKCIDRNEKELFYLKYRIHNGFSESLMAVSDSKRWNKDARFGFVDRKGNLTIDINFTPYLLKDGSIYYPRFNNGRAYVRYNGRNGYIDKTGKFSEEE